MKQRLYAQIDGGPAQWLVTKNINPVTVGVNIYVKSYASWVDPCDWLYVHVKDKTVSADGQVTFILVTKE